MYSSFLKKLDFPLILIVSLLIGSGLLSLYGIGERAREFFFNQLIFAIIGFAAMILMANVDYRVFKNNSFAVMLPYFISTVLLLTVLKQTSFNVARWIVVYNFQFQPSEIAKLTLLILMAKYFTQKHVEINNIGHIVSSFVYMAIPAFLVFIQPNFGSSVIFFTIWLSVLYVSGVNRRHIVAIAIILTVVLSIGWVNFLEPYQRNRIISFLNPFADPKGEGYSIIQSRIAIGSGGWFGKGFGKGTQASAGFLPESHTDFAFSSFVEQFGVVGFSALAILFTAFILRVGRICKKAGNNFSKLFGIGFLALVGSHVLLNIGIAFGFLPVTGLPLTFISYGGTHLITVMIGVGIIQSIKINTA